MSKDGPPISSGYRHGGLAALRTGLPASATALRSKPTEGERKARQRLVDFAAYPERTKSIGKPLPATRGISKGQAESRRRIEELKQEELVDMSVTLFEEGGLKIKWVRRGAHKHRLLEVDTYLGITRVSSITYDDLDHAFYNWNLRRVRWIDNYSLP